MTFKWRLAWGTEPIKEVEHEAGGLAQLIDDSADVSSTVTLSSADKISNQPVATVANVSEVNIDKSILNYSTLNGALDLLPESWACITFIPLQIKIVYRIEKAHGVELDTRHIKEFIGATGFALTSQYIEQFGRKLLGGLLSASCNEMPFRVCDVMI
ncbi:MAG: hypothetical protein Q8R74_12350 [Methylophilus sp.]|nr:hypothetical protein [Methylophilus sp.]